MVTEWRKDCHRDAPADQIWSEKRNLLQSLAPSVMGRNVWCTPQQSESRRGTRGYQHGPSQHDDDMIRFYHREEIDVGDCGYYPQLNNEDLDRRGCLSRRH